MSSEVTRDMSSGVTRDMSFEVTRDMSSEVTRDMSSEDEKCDFFDIYYDIQCSNRLDTEGSGLGEKNSVV